MAYKRKVPRECIGCSARQPTSEAPDPCLGMLPGVRFACCGHGSARQCYVAYEDGRVVRGEEARQDQIAMGGHPAELSRSDHHTWKKI